ncbi:MAG: translation initiation factor IF-3 [Mycoplasmataceae bacterium]|nr:translation initiation factor IF-3 [Mycoplasmataceae bacterium]
MLVIDQNGDKLGILSKQDAIKKAQAADLDLVLISDKGDIVVTKIVDYGKFRFERKKQEQENKRNQKVVENKEVRLSPNIGRHDLDVRMRNAQKFLEKGARVKVSLAFKGRQMANKEIGFETMKLFLKELESVAQIDKQPRLNGRFLDAYISPIKNKKPGE